MYASFKLIFSHQISIVSRWNLNPNLDLFIRRVEGIRYWTGCQGCYHPNSHQIYSVGSDQIHCFCVSNLNNISMVNLFIRFDIPWRLMNAATLYQPQSLYSKLRMLFDLRSSFAKTFTANVLKMVWVCWKSCVPPVIRIRCTTQNSGRGHVGCSVKSKMAITSMQQH